MIYIQYRHKAKQPLKFVVNNDINMFDICVRSMTICVTLLHITLLQKLHIVECVCYVFN